MISDVLAEAVEAIDSYLNDPTFERTYAGEVRTKIVTMRMQMDEVRAELDRPPQ
jgi:hypothetical protein